jgi:hypothetical protein
MKINLKAYVNQKNGQVRYHWPKQTIKIAPNEIQLEINKKQLNNAENKSIIGRMKWW